MPAPLPGFPNASDRWAPARCLENRARNRSSRSLRFSHPIFAGYAGFRPHRTPDSALRVPAAVALLFGIQDSFRFRYPLPRSGTENQRASQTNSLNLR